MNKPSRRTFLAASGKGLAATGLLAFGQSAKASPLDRVQHAVIGLGSQGRRHAAAFAALDQCEVVAMCDVDPSRREHPDLRRSWAERVKKVRHYSEILEDESVDSVSIATPDHWHTPIALAALNAGKHVYVEKPCCHNVQEGRLLQAFSARHGKCVQHGTQSRSGKGIVEAIRFLRDGGLGKIRMAKAINHQLREPIGRAPVADPPPGVDYDLWTGPAPVHPFTKNRWHYNWHWFWDYGTGDIGNDGIHQIDVARWGLGEAWPKTVNASGGQLFYDDDHETPDTQVVTFEFESSYLLYEMRLWTDYKMDGHDNGTVFYGDKGTLEVGRRGCEVTFIGKEKKRLGGGDDFEGNVRNFIECVKNDDPAGLNSPIAEGIISSTLCHLGNISTRLGRRVHYDEVNGKITGDDEATKLLTRNYRNGYELPALT